MTAAGPGTLPRKDHVPRSGRSRQKVPAPGAARAGGRESAQPGEWDGGRKWPRGRASLQRPEGAPVTSQLRFSPGGCGAGVGHHPASRAAISQGFFEAH